MALSIHAGYTSPVNGDVEVVERKGIGHPDTICDAIAEEICRDLCRAYLERCGVILHHNVDKILLCGGAARPAFGGGGILEPIEIYLGGRATSEYAGKPIPIADIAVDACRAWLRACLPALDVERGVRVIPRFHPGSGSLTSLFSAGRGSAVVSNDTSCGAGFAPLTPLERVVFEVEKAFNGPKSKLSHPAIGQDVKVMGVRRGSRVHLTIGCAMIGRHLANVAEYTAVKSLALELALDAARRITDMEVNVVVNAADDIDRGEIFLTVTGTSAESGDDGETGRGNRVSGLITPYRPMTLEAAAGKNPVNHVGKLYNLAACRIANRTVQEIGGISEASCVLVSQIGHRIDDPQVVDLSLDLQSEAQINSVIAASSDIVTAELQRFDALTADLLAARVSVF